MGRGKARSGGKKGKGPGVQRSIRFDAVVTPPDAGARPRDPDKPPEILLRKLTLAEALDRLETQLRAWAAQGQDQVLVVHGKGSRSDRGIPVLGPEVRRWCSEHQRLVSSWEEAPPRWGGAGAIVVRLR
ncbi:MAG: Smr/MutS family protein [Krumholzibacteria bacterium]|nr:Smr/MutS family protein [Candidatus Krumholzibacteria bacterium]